MFPHYKKSRKRINEDFTGETPTRRISQMTQPVRKKRFTVKFVNGTSKVQKTLLNNIYFALFYEYEQEHLGVRKQASGFCTTKLLDIRLIKISMVSTHLLSNSVKCLEILTAVGLDLLISFVHSFTINVRVLSNVCKNRIKFMHIINSQNMPMLKS